MRDWLGCYCWSGCCGGVGEKEGGSMCVCVGGGGGPMQERVHGGCGVRLVGSPVSACHVILTCCVV